MPIGQEVHAEAFALERRTVCMFILYSMYTYIICIHIYAYYTVAAGREVHTEARSIYMHFIQYTFVYYMYIYTYIIPCPQGRRCTQRLANSRKWWWNNELATESPR